MQWLLFIPQLPAKPDYLRVKLRRRLTKLGALPLKAAVYALPHQGDCLEDFAWLRQDLRKDGGDAVICASSFISGLSDEATVALFQQHSSRRYAELVEEAGNAGREEAQATLNRLRRRLNHVVATDYFEADGRRAAERALRALERLQGEARME